MRRSRIRTATETSRKPRLKKWTGRALTAVVVAAGSQVSLAGSAQAYPGSLCPQLFGAGNVYDVDEVRINTKHVDFGDLPHSGAGAGRPLGSAVICWSNDRRVAIVGRGFYDSPSPHWGKASVSVRGWSGTAGWWAVNIGSTRIPER